MFKIIKKTEIKIKENNFASPVDGLLVTLSNGEHYIQKSWGHNAGGRFFIFQEVNEAEYQAALTTSQYTLPDPTIEVKNKVSRKHFSISYSDLNHNKVGSIRGFSIV